MRASMDLWLKLWDQWNRAIVAEHLTQMHTEHGH